MRALAEQCVEFSVATAFVTTGAIDDIISAAIEANARVRFLTGTFGKNTRQSTFRRLLSLSKRDSVQVRVWSTDRHSDFHAKLYIWDFSKERAAAWIGSANFTNGGLQVEGEVVLEVRSNRRSPLIQQLRAGFEREWGRGTPLTAKFVDEYRESTRPPPDASVKGGKRPALTVSSPRGSTRCLTAYVTSHYEEDGRGMRRVDALLGGTADAWFRTPNVQARRAKAGDRLLLVDLVDDTIALGIVTDVVADGRARVLAYELVVRRGDPWRPWTIGLQRRAADAGGFRPRGRSLGTRWLSPNQARSIVAEIYPGKQIR